VQSVTDSSGDKSVKEDFQSRQTTAKKAAAILVAKDIGFFIPNAKQKQNQLVAFAKKGKVIYVAPASPGFGHRSRGQRSRPV
jgi:hypothetical protein